MKMFTFLSFMKQIQSMLPNTTGTWYDILPSAPTQVPHNMLMIRASIHPGSADEGDAEGTKGCGDNFWNQFLVNPC
jgi:hypothetical protein